MYARSLSASRHSHRRESGEKKRAPAALERANEACAAMPPAAAPHAERDCQRKPTERQDPNTVHELAIFKRLGLKRDDVLLIAIIALLIMEKASFDIIAVLAFLLILDL